VAERLGQAPELSGAKCRSAVTGIEATPGLTRRHGLGGERWRLTAPGLSGIIWQSALIGDSSHVI